MKIRELKYEKDCGLAISTEEIYVPALESSVEIWANTDCEEQLQPTEKQFLVFENFLKVQSEEFHKLTMNLENYRKSLIQQGRIVRRTKTFRSYKELKFKQILLPKQSNAKEQFLFIFADTDWKIKYCEFPVELEILFADNRLELVQEMTGLWTRMEWSSDYNVNGE